jgi:hypothetical protein
MRADTPRATSSPNHTKSSLTQAYAARVLRRLLHLCGAKAHSREIFMKRKLALARSLIAMRFHILRACCGATLLGNDRSPHFYSGRLGISFRGGGTMFCKILRDAVNFKI